MVKKSISIDLDEKLLKQLEKRAKTNHLSVREQIKDIIVRSMSGWDKTGRSYGDPNVSKLVKIFSRKRPGPKPKK
jgi:hypothetical protein|tara:strand:+ start:111 stop:335 length:225 start_codon:yes stop_codon:yes gene_type:complete